MPRAIASPMPVPFVSNLWRRPRKNLSKIRRRSFSSMPGPRSATLITILPPFSSAETADRRALGSVLERVFHELLQDLCRKFGVGIGGRQAGSDGGRNATRVRHPQIREHRLDQLCGRDGASFQVQFACLDPGHFDHLRGEAVQAVGLFVDDREQLVIGAGGLSQHAGNRGLDGGERGLDVVSQRIEKRGFQHFALTCRLGVAGFFQRTRLFDGQRREVDDGARGCLGRGRTGQRQAAQGPASEADGRDHQTLLMYRSKCPRSPPPPGGRAPKESWPPVASARSRLPDGNRKPHR